MTRSSAAAAALVAVFVLCLLVFQERDSAFLEDDRQNSRVELYVRSATMVIRDLAEAWDEQHYRESTASIHVYAGIDGRCFP